MALKNQKYFKGDTCKTPGCNSRPSSMGYCHRCYNRVTYKKKSNPANRPTIYTQNSVCKTEGCERKPVAKGLCAACYNRMKRTRENKRQELIKSNERLYHTKQKQTHVVDVGGISINEMWQVRMSYTGYVSLHTGLFVGYPHHCFLVDSIVEI